MHPKPKQPQDGFTLLELLVTTVLVVLASLTFIVLFRSTIFNFMTLQTDGSASVALTTQSNRIGMVVRGATDITAASASDLQMYAYFYPSDTYVSLLHYYLRTQNGVTQLVADLTPMNANPPIGTPIIGSKRTFVVIDNYHQLAGKDLFTYLSANGTALPHPISEPQAIKGVQITLAAKTANNSYQIQTVQVTLRNRKTNL